MLDQSAVVFTSRRELDLGYIDTYKHIVFPPILLQRGSSSLRDAGSSSQATGRAFAFFVERVAPIATRGFENLGQGGLLPPDLLKSLRH